MKKWQLKLTVRCASPWARVRHTLSVVTLPVNRQRYQYDDFESLQRILSPRRGRKSFAHGEAQRTVGYVAVLMFKPPKGVAAIAAETVRCLPMTNGKAVR